MTPALIMLVVPGLPSYNRAEVSYLKGVIGLPIVISFSWQVIYSDIHIFFLEMGSLMTSSSSAGPIQISKFPEPCRIRYVFVENEVFVESEKNILIWNWVLSDIFPV